MFELRWVEYSESAGLRENKLQFRTKDNHVDSSTTTPIEPRWSEWTDVPTEMEK